MWKRISSSMRASAARRIRKRARARIACNHRIGNLFAAGKYLQSRPDVDPGRVGIWGLSYGGLLTAQALARNSDLFVAGVDMAGVDPYGRPPDTANNPLPSAPISEKRTRLSPCRENCP